MVRNTSRFNRKKQLSKIRKARHNIFRFYVQNLANGSVTLEKLKEIKNYYEEQGLPSSDPMKVYVDMLQQVQKK